MNRFAKKTPNLMVYCFTHTK